MEVIIITAIVFLALFPCLIIASAAYLWYEKLRKNNRKEINNNNLDLLHELLKNPRNKEIKQELLKRIEKELHSTLISFENFRFMLKEKIESLTGFQKLKIDEITNLIALFQSSENLKALELEPSDKERKEHYLLHIGNFSSQIIKEAEKIDRLSFLRKYLFQYRDKRLFLYSRKQIIALQNEIKRIAKNKIHALELCERSNSTPRTHEEEHLSRNVLYNLAKIRPLEKKKLATGLTLEKLEAAKKAFNAVIVERRGNENVSQLAVCKQLLNTVVINGVNEDTIGTYKLKNWGDSKAIDIENFTPENLKELASKLEKYDPYIAVNLVENILDEEKEISESDKNQLKGMIAKLRASAGTITLSSQLEESSTSSNSSSSSNNSSSSSSNSSINDTLKNCEEMLKRLYLRNIPENVTKIAGRQLFQHDLKNGERDYYIIIDNFDNYNQLLQEIKAENPELKYHSLETICRDTIAKATPSEENKEQIERLQNIIGILEQDGKSAQQNETPEGIDDSNKLLEEIEAENSELKYYSLETQCKEATDKVTSSEEDKEQIESLQNIIGILEQDGKSAQQNETSEDIHISRVSAWNHSLEVISPIFYEKSPISPLTSGERDKSDVTVLRTINALGNITDRFNSPPPNTTQNKGKTMDTEGRSENRTPLTNSFFW